jgi:hypothetical protein
MITFLALWLCALSIAAIYYTIPPKGMRPDIYEIALWILSSCALATSAIIIVVSLVSPTTDQSKVVEFSFFAAALLLHLAQLKANFGGESKASLGWALPVADAGNSFFSLALRRGTVSATLLSTQPIERAQSPEVQA